MTNQVGVISVELVDGTKVMVPDSLELITSYVLQEQGDWFEDEIKFLRQLVQPGDTVVDIGANYGVYALSLARKVGPSGQLWAFEPATDTAQLLRESSSANGTTWLQVVQQALSDREGTAWLQMPGQAELNSLADPSSLDAAAQQGSGESVAVTTLDRCLETYGWTRVDLLKIDAEGEEERILNGGKRFFHELSPLVMFEVKAGAELHLELVNHFQELGYQSFRLIPGLNALVPFSAEQAVDGYLLNLFAAKPDRVAKLADEGWLVERTQDVAPEPDSLEMDSWLEALADKAYARRLAARWQLQAQQPEQALIRRALEAWAVSQDRDAPIVKRTEALTHSFALLQEACKPGCEPGRWASLARVALACGERVEAVHALNNLILDLQSGRKADLDEPFLSPDAEFDAIEPTGPAEAWLEASGIAALEECSSYSSFYTGENALPRLQRFIEIGYTKDEIQRRLDLLRRRFDCQSQENDSSASVRSWFDFLGLEEPLRCVDVGALALQENVDPWVRWAQGGCAEVLGFEPLQAECEQLNHKAQQSGLAIRYLPWALGDGLEHTLHITNVPMTSSLFPPARTTVDLFPALGELMQVEQQLQVQTHRLDDIQEAAGMDFLKLDVQGAELMILENAKFALRSVSVIQCEVEFVELYEGQPLMADIDAFLRSQGFCFLRFAYTMGRPFKPLQKAGNPTLAISQMLWGDAIYVRDFRRVHEWSDRQLKSAAFVLHELYEAFDLATIILEELDHREKSDLTSCYLGALLLNQQDFSL
jgi:protein O-GlcNAc transferase